MRRFLHALGFLTIVPAAPPGGDGRELARSVAYFPLVGAMFGGVLALLAFVLSLRLSALTVAVLTVGAWTALSGALHLDGLADTVDGLGGGRDREKRLLIMKDSRIGTFGAAALAIALLVKVALVAEHVGIGTAALWAARGGELPGGFSVRFLTPLILAPVAGRLVMTFAILLFPPARPGGMGRTFKEHCRPVDGVIAGCLGIAVSLLFGGLWGLVLPIGVGGLALLAARRLSRGLGGLTGDTYGALCEGTEIACLLTSLFLPAAGVLRGTLL